MGFSEVYEKAKAEYGFGGKRFVSQDDFPLKCVVVGTPIYGLARFARNSYVSATKEEGGKFRFAVNVFDGETCRMLEGGKALFGKLQKIDADVGLESNWVEIGREGTGQQAPYYAKAGGTISAAEKRAIAEAEKLPLAELAKWYESEDDSF